MKRCLVLSLCAVALTVAGISPALANVKVALNLRYNDPADPSEGGTWTLVAKSSTASSQGITGLVVRFVGNTMPAAGTVNASIGHDIVAGNALVVGSFDHDNDGNTPAQTEFVYGQDPNDGLVANVGLSSGPSNVVVDPLRNNPVGYPGWGNASVIATGTIANLTVRPQFAFTAANERVGGVIGLATMDASSVRGDTSTHLAIEAPNTGLLRGDIDRNGDVTTGDLSVLLGKFSAAPGALGWGDGDFSDDGDVATGDLSLLLGNFAAAPTNPGPPISAVPEPGTLVLAALALAGLGYRRQR